MSFVISSQNNQGPFSQGEDAVKENSKNAGPSSPRSPLDFTQSELYQFLPSLSAISGLNRTQISSAQKVYDENKMRSCVTSLVEKRMGDVQSLTSTTREITEEHFTAYLVAAPTQGGIDGLKKIFNLREVLQKDIAASKTEGSVKSLLSEEGGALKLDLKKNIIQINNTSGEMEITPGCRECLDSFGLEVKEKIGEGACGVVFDTSLAGEKGTYVLKLEKEIRLEPFAEVEGLAFHERGDLAASCIKKLVNMTKPIFVIVALQKSENSEIEYHYVSAMEAESFTKEIASHYPEAKVGMAAQLMERVAGVELEIAAKGNFPPSEKDYKNVEHSLIGYFINAISNGYLHRDIKPRNIIYNGHEAKIIDGGFAVKSKAASGFVDRYGTPNYVSPRVYYAKKGSEYGAEVDGYSIGMSLFQIIDKKSFDSLTELLDYDATKNSRNFSPQILQEITDLKNEFEQRLLLQDPPDYFENYIAAVTKMDSDAVILKELAKPENKTHFDHIRLLFQISFGGAEKEEALHQLEESYGKNEQQAPSSENVSSPKNRKYIKIQNQFRRMAQQARIQ